MRYRRAGIHGCINYTPIQCEDFREFVLSNLTQKGTTISVDIASNFEDLKNKEIKQLERELYSIEVKSKDLIDLYLEDRLITKVEFQVRRGQYEKYIRRINDRLFLLSQDQDVEIDIRTIQEAFQQLERSEEDLKAAFESLIDKILIHPDGEIDFTYTFESKL